MLAMTRSKVGALIIAAVFWGVVIASFPHIFSAGTAEDAPKPSHSPSEVDDRQGTPGYYADMDDVPNPKGPDSEYGDTEADPFG